MTNKKKKAKPKRRAPRVNWKHRARDAEATVERLRSELEKSARYRHAISALSDAIMEEIRADVEGVIEDRLSDIDVHLNY